VELELVLLRACCRIGAGAGAEDQPFQQRIARQPIGAVQPEQLASPIDISGETRSARQIRIDAADHVMRRGMDRIRSLLTSMSNSSQSLASCGKSLAELRRGEMTHVEKDVRVMRLANLLDDRAADDVARRKLLIA